MAAFAIEAPLELGGTAHRALTGLYLEGLMSRSAVNAVWVGQNMKPETKRDESNTAAALPDPRCGLPSQDFLAGPEACQPVLAEPELPSEANGRNVVSGCERQTGDLNQFIEWSLLPG